MAVKSAYVVYHKHCGHILGVTNERRLANDTLSALLGPKRFQFRIRHDRLSDAEIRDLLTGVRCEKCSIDGGAPDAS